MSLSPGISTSIFCLIVLAVRYGHSQCPFASSLRQGQLSEAADQRRKANLISRDFLIDPSDPAYVIWQTSPYDAETIAAYTASNALLQAEQSYVERTLIARASNRTCGDGSANTLRLLRSVSDTVPRAARCKPQPKCDPHHRYVLANGSCNNLLVPTRGSHSSAYSRLVRAHYDDHLYAVRLAKRTRDALPSPRRIGNDPVMKRSVYDPAPSVVPNHGSLLFGQYITHDAGFRDVHQNYDGGDGLRCCSKDNRRPLMEPLDYPYCMAMQVPADDPYYAQFGGGCLDYIRSQAVFGENCHLGPADIASSVTQWLDHSSVYGSSADIQQTVRAPTGGRLLIDNGIMAYNRSCTTADFCYFTGDPRGSFYPTLSLWTSVFIRFHNYLADALAVQNAHWSHQVLFEEARRLSTAIYQRIVYDEWLPLYLGADECRKHGLSCAEDDLRCGRYDAGVDGRNMNEFAVGAFRLFHVNTPQNIDMYNADYTLNLSLPLSQSIHGAELLEKQYLGMMRGFFKEPIHIGPYPDNIRNEVFNNDNANGIGMDLLAVDIMRGRDHGLAPYTTYLLLSGHFRTGKARVEWSDLCGLFADESIEALRRMYDQIDDIDLMVGLLLEQKRGTLVGPVSAYLLGEQFRRFKFGNRFHYTFAESPNAFSLEQIKSINRVGFSDVLCAVSSIGRVPERVFETLGAGNKLHTCAGRAVMVNFALWKEKRPLLGLFGQ